MSSVRVASLITLALLIPIALPLVPTSVAAETGPARIVLLQYDSFSSIPTDSWFDREGIQLNHRLVSIPAIVVLATEAEITRLRLAGGVQSVTEDQPLQYFMQTAVLSTNVANVWGVEWWPTASDVALKPQIIVDGEVIDGRGITVGVVDSGIQATHPDLFWEPGHVEGVTPWEPKVLACYSTVPFVRPGNGVDNPHCDQTVGHGTHVAGIVAGNAWAARNGLAPLLNPARPPMGAAPGATLVGAGLGAGISIVDAAAGLDIMYARAEQFGIRVVTNSWGDTPGCTAALPSQSDAVLAITKKLVEDKGITVLFAAGNYDNSGATWTSTYSRNPFPGVISVANYNDLNSGTRMGRVNTGSSDGCVAAGGAADYVWTWPDVSAPGTAITSTTLPSVTVHAIGAAGYPTQQHLPFYATIDGTSMATPHVAGIVALMYQANPDITPAQVEEIIVKTSTRWTDTISSRGVAGTQMWSTDPTNCKVSPADAAAAESGNPAVNAEFPLFTQLAQVTDASLYVCRDYRRGVGLVDAYAAVQEAIALRGGPESPAVRITSPANGAEVAPGVVTVTGTVDLYADGTPVATLSATPLTGTAPLEVTFTPGGSDTDGTVASWSLDFGDATTPASGTGTPPASVSHVYATVGARTATLTVTDDSALTASASVSLDISSSTSTGRVLWLVGDGTDTAITGTETPLEDKTFALSATSNGGQETTYTSAGSWNPDAPGNAFMPTFATTGTVTIAEGSTVSLKVHVDSTNVVNAVGNICGLVAQLFDGSGTVLGPAGGASAYAAPGLGAYREVTWTFTPAPGTYNGFGVQFGTSGVDCGTPPVTFAWGTAALNGRVILGPNDQGGGPGPSAITMDARGDAPASLDIVSVAPTLAPGILRATIALGAKPTAGDLYALRVDGITLLAAPGAGTVRDAATGLALTGASVSFDAALRTVSFRIPTSGLELLGAKAPFEIGVQTLLLSDGVLVAADQAPDTLGAGAVKVIEDAAGDALVQGSDITAGYVHDETVDSFKVSLVVGDLDQNVPSTLGLGGSALAGLRQDYTVRFAYPEAPGNLVTYQVSAAKYLLDPLAATPPAPAYSFKLQTAGFGTTTFLSTIGTPVGSWDEANRVITWTVLKSDLDVKKAPTSNADTTGQLTGGRIPETGDLFQDFTAETRAWIYAAAGLGPGQTIWDTGAGVTSYTLTGGNSLPTATLSATPAAGAPPLQVTFTLGATDADGAIASWSLDHGDATPPASGTGAPPASLQHTYAALGSYTARLTVVDDDGGSGQATVAIGVGSAAERVEILLGAAPVAVVPVTTSAQQPTAAFSAPVDLTGLSGPQTITAKWYDASGSTLRAAATTTFDVLASEPFVAFTAPTPGATLSEVVDVAGIAGHRDDAESASAAPLRSATLVPHPEGGSALRATTTYGFEGGAAGWTVTNDPTSVGAQTLPGPSRQAQSSWHLQTEYAPSGSAWYVGDDVTLTYAPGSVSNLVSPSLDLSGATTASLAFDLGGNVAEGDALLVQWKAAGAPNSAYETLATIADENVDADFNIVYARNTIALPAAALGQEIVLRLRFVAETDPDVAFGIPWGYVVDNVALTTQSGVVNVPSAPAAPVGVAGVQSATLTWSPPAEDGGAPVSSYKLYRDGVLLAQTALLTYTDTGLTGGATYAYAVSAVNEAGESARSASTQVTALSSTTTGPDLAITSPAQGAEVAGNVSFAGTYGTGGDGDVDPPVEGARVIVAVIDSGINVYHSDFYAGGLMYPDSAPAAVTPAVLAELGIDAAHQVTLTRTGNFAADYAADAALWARIAADADALWWFKGTNVIGTSPGAVPGRPIMGDVEPTAVLGGDEHGTGTAASVLLQNPEAIILFVEDTDEDSENFAFNHPAVDIVSTSYGPQGSVPFVTNPLYGWDVERTHMASSYTGVVTLGKLHFGAADNTASPAVQDSTSGAWWSIGVTGWDDSAGGKQSSSGTLADFASSFTVNVPYAISSETERGTPSGTSFATPTAAGTASKVLLEARRAANHTGGIVEVAGVPAMVAGDGDTLTNWEIRRALEEAAVYGALAEYDPIEGLIWQSIPPTPVAPWSTVGWGILQAKPDVVGEALRQLAGTPTRTKGPDACLAMTGLIEARRAYYDSIPFSDSFLTTEDPYLRCDPLATGPTFQPLVASAPQIVDGEDDVPAPPPYDIVSVNVTDDGRFLHATWTMSFILGDNETAAPDANGAWWDFSFKVGETEYLLEAQGEVDAGQVGTGYTATLWGRTLNQIGQPAWGVVADATTAFSMDWAANQFTASVELADIGATPGTTIENTWAATWPNTRASYVVAYDTAPNGAAHESEGGDAFGADHVVGGEDEEEPPAGEQVRIEIAGPTAITGNATLAPATSTWAFDPEGSLAPGAYTVTATYLEDGVVLRGPVQRAFTVTSEADTTPPILGEISVSTTMDSAQVSWATDEDATTLVEYGPTASYGASVGPAGLRRAHQVSIGGLEPGTTYHFRVTSADASGNGATSEDATFVTLTVENDLVDVLVDDVRVARLAVDTTSGDDAWSTTLDTTSLADGTHVLSANFVDADGRTATASMVVSVDNADNRAPVIAAISDQTVAETQLLEVTVDASDPDGDTITLETEGLPEGAVFHANTRTLSYAPGYFDAGNYTVTVRASDGELTSSRSFRITVVDTPRAPVLGDIAPQTVRKGATMTFVASATDPDLTTPQLSASGLVHGATFVDSADGTGTFTWTPGGAVPPGEYTVVVTAADATGMTASKDALITVIEINRAPVLGAIGDLGAVEGATLTYVLEATDADNDALTFAATGLPAGAGFGVENRTLWWTPGFEEAGTYTGITFTVSDGELTDSETIRILVADTNRAPVVDAMDARSVLEGETLSFVVTASDPDGDALTFTAIGLPAGATFENATFGWTPSFGQSGDVIVTFRATDGSLADTLDLLITVGNVNLPPTLEPIGPKSALENATLTFQVNGADPDGPVRYRMTPAPLGAQLNGATGVFTWKPTFAQAGVYEVLFEVDDGEISLSELVTITVANNDRLPVLNAIPAMTVYQGTPIDLAVQASDADGEVITLDVTGPAGMALSNQGNGRGRLTWTPGVDALGDYVVTVTAVAGEGVATRDTTFRVLFKTAVAVAHVTPPTTQASPGEERTLLARVSNTGPNVDTFRITATNNVGWTIGPMPADVTLAAGESAVVPVTVVADGARPIGQTTIVATSTADATVAKSAKFRVEIPVVITLHLAEPMAPLVEAPAGKVVVTYLDGTLAKGASVRVIQTPSTSSALKSTQSGITNAAGEFSFDFRRDMGAILPGTHKFVVVASKGTGPDTQLVTSYQIGASP